MLRASTLVQACWVWALLPRLTMSAVEGCASTSGSWTTGALACAPLQLSEQHCQPSLRYKQHQSRNILCPWAPVMTPKVIIWGATIPRNSFGTVIATLFMVLRGLFAKLCNNRPQTACNFQSWDMCPLNHPAFAPQPNLPCAHV